MALAAVLALGSGVIPRVFTTSPEVRDVISGPWWVMTFLVVIGGVLFALDGVLLGAGDAAFLRTLTLVSVLLGFLPGVWLAYALDAGLAGVWGGIAAFIVIRMVGVMWRFYSMRWARV